jgi:hypothetical protein
MVRPMAAADHGSGPNEWQNLLAVFHFRADGRKPEFGTLADNFRLIREIGIGAAVAR